MIFGLGLKRGLDRKAVENASGLTRAELRRYFKNKVTYLETSAFNYFVDNFEIDELELTRGYQRRKRRILITSPLLLWEIMLSADKDRADQMLLAAQALFDPILLATPSELVVRYLRHAYPRNVVNYSFFTKLAIAELWRPMTEDFCRTFSFDGHLEKAALYRVVSRNLRSVIEGRAHDVEYVSLATTYVQGVYAAVEQDLAAWGVDDVIAKFVILYVFLLLMVNSDIDSAEVDAFWEERGYGGKLTQAQITSVFIDFPEIFICGPILEMATMASLQYKTGATNRGALHDGMHMAYAPYVDEVISNDAAFLRLSKEHKFYRRKVFHLSNVAVKKVRVRLARFPNDQKLRSIAEEEGTASSGRHRRPRGWEALKALVQRRE